MIVSAGLCIRDVKKNYPLYLLFKVKAHKIHNKYFVNSGIMITFASRMKSVER